MAKPIKYSTKQEPAKVDIDGNIWDIKLPGAGTELRFSQASRACRLNGARIDLLDKKIDAGTITEDELDNYETYTALYEEAERSIYDIFSGTFQDGTKANKHVKAWLEETPTAYIMRAFTDVTEAADDQSKKPA